MNPETTLTVESLLNSSSEAMFSTISGFVTCLLIHISQTPALRLRLKSQFGPSERADMRVYIDRSTDLVQQIAIIKEAVYTRSSRSSIAEIFQLRGLMETINDIRPDLSAVIKEFDGKLVAWWHEG